MLTDYELWLIERYGRLVARVPVFGLTWDATARTLHVSNSKTKALAAFGLYNSGAALLLNSLIRLHRIFVSETESSTAIEQVIYIYLCITNVSISFTFLSYAVQKAELVQLYNMMLVYSRRKPPSTDSQRKNKILRSFQPLMGLSSVTSISLITICEGLLAFNWTGSTCFALGLAAMNLLCDGCMVLFAGLMQAFLVHYFVIVAHELQPPQARVEETTAESIKALVQSYRCLTLLCDSFNGAFSKKLIPNGKYSASLIGMLSFVLALRLKGVDDPLAVPVSLTIISIVLYLWGAVIVVANMMTSVWERSCAYISGFGHLRTRRQAGVDRKELKMVARSFLPLRFYVGGVYYMEKEAKLTLFQFLVTGTVNILLVLG